VGILRQILWKVNKALRAFPDRPSRRQVQCASTIRSGAVLPLKSPGRDRAPLISLASRALAAFLNTGDAIVPAPVSAGDSAAQPFHRQDARSDLLLQHRAWFCGKAGILLHPTVLYSTTTNGVFAHGRLRSYELRGSPPLRGRSMINAAPSPPARILATASRLHRRNRNHRRRVC